VVHDNLPEIENGRAPVAVVYQKGAWTLHMLRAQLGTEAFWATMREYYRRYRDGNASTEDFERVAEETAHADLAGSSANGYTAPVSRHRRRLALGRSRQESGARLEADPARRNLPAPIEIAIAGAGRPERVAMTRREEHFEFACDKEPSAVDLDPNTWLLADIHVSKM